MSAYRKMQVREWDKIYVAVDWHDTICRSNYDQNGAFDFIDGAIEGLKALSDCKETNLILYTSSFSHVVDQFLLICERDHGIKFDAFNENPEVPNTEYGDFRDKFFFDILLDDKAGFDPETDWDIVIWHVNYLFSKYETIWTNFNWSIKCSDDEQ